MTPGEAAAKASQRLAGRFEPSEPRRWGGSDFAGGGTDNSPKAKTGPRASCKPPALHVAADPGGGMLKMAACTPAAGDMVPTVSLLSTNHAN